MPENLLPQFIFVDFENVPNVDLGLILDPLAHVTLLLGKNQKSISLPMVQHIQRLGDRIKLVEVGASGRNALDLTLACYLGQALADTPGARFTIVSKDKDFDAMIAHLQGKGTKIARQESLAIPSTHKAPPKKSAPTRLVKVPVSAPSRSAKAVARLMNPGSRNRPATHKALVAHLKTSLGKEASDASVQGIIDELTRRGLIVDASGHVGYPAH